MLQRFKPDFFTNQKRHISLDGITIDMALSGYDWWKMGDKLKLSFNLKFSYLSDSNSNLPIYLQHEPISLVLLHCKTSEIIQIGIKDMSLRK